jgi:glutamine---fructose-6-phosphate transaminase (isomerizing)
MGNAGEFTRAEILSQPQAWAEILDTLDTQALAEYFQKERFDSVLFTGCGSTYYLSVAASAVFQNLTGIPSRGLPASEIWLYPKPAYVPAQRHLLVVVSRSGETTETVRAVEAFKERGHGSVITFTCYPDSTLARLGNINVVLIPGQEQSVAQTRAFSALFLAVTTFAAACAGRKELLAQVVRLPDVCNRLLTDYGALAHDLGVDPLFDRFYFLAGGTRYGLAAEISLKMKEMSLSHSEPFHFMEFRHGPMSMVTDTSMIVGLLSEHQANYESAVLNEMQARGAKIISLAEANASVIFNSGVDETIRDVLYLPISQLLAFEHALSKGLNPDQPHNLSAVVRLS